MRQLLRQFATDVSGKLALLRFTTEQGYPDLFAVLFCSGKRISFFFLVFVYLNESDNFEFKDFFA